MTIEEIEEEAGGGTVGRPHIAAVMVRKGYVRVPGGGVRSLADRRSARAYVGRHRLTPRRRSRWLGNRGRCRCSPTPTRSPSTVPQRWRTSHRLVRAGLVGLEANYAGYRRHEREGYADLARRFGLVPSGGSDYHGAYKPGLEWGGIGDLDVPESVVEGLRAHAGRT